MRRWGWLVAAGLACAPSPSSSSDDATSGTPPPPGTTSLVADTTADDGMTSSLPPDPATTGLPPVTTGPAGDSSGDVCVPGDVECYGSIYACGDQLDNDGDGLVDLDDPECITPCDDREETFDTGLPGDNFDCRLDCVFDGNSGQGDDMCNHHLACDPADPGGTFGCPANPSSPSCPRMLPTPQVPECRAFCEPRTPPGCDCFGCCEVQTRAGPLAIYVGDFAACSLADPIACPSCTLQIDECGTPCDPAACMQCFGQSGPPPGCDTVTCPYGEPCDDECDCPGDAYCMLGCCYPAPAG